MEKTNWYVVFTASRAEKRVKLCLEQAGIENYLPVRVVERECEGQIRRIEVPIISGCVFVRVSEVGLSSLLSTCGIIALLKSERVPVTISDEQVENLRLLNERAGDIEVVDKAIPSGEMVRVVQGELLGIRGELIRVADRHQIVIRVSHLAGVCADIGLDSVERL